MKQLVLICVACCMAVVQLSAQNRIIREKNPERFVRTFEFDSPVLAKNDAYCPSFSGNDEYEFISNVSFAGINHNSGGSFYSDFTDIFATVEAGNVYVLAVTVSNENGEKDYDERLLVWIDWNQNQVFDPDELYDLGVKTVAMGSTEVFTKSIHVPADAKTGNTRMRISLKYYEPAEYDENFPGEEWWGYSEEFYLDPCATYDPDFEPDLSYEGGMDNFEFGEVEDYSVTVIETTDTHQITATASPQEGGTVTGAGTYADGAEVTLTATPAQDFAFVRWSENGDLAHDQPQYTFTALADRDLVAEFEHMGYTLALKAEPEGAGTVTAEPDRERYQQGEEITLTATPQEGNQFIRWEDHAEEILSEEASFVFTMPGEHTTLTAFFDAITHQITATASPQEGGTVTGAGTYADGAEVTLTATPAEDFAFVRWSENGDLAHDQAQYTFTARADRDLVAEFEHMGYTLALKAEPGGAGTVMAEPERERYQQGEQITLTATPHEGNRFIRWEDHRQQEISTEASFEFSMPGEHTTLTAFFDAITHQITATASPQEGGTVTGAGTYADGAEVTLTATPAQDFAFVRWSENGDLAHDQPQYTFTARADRDLVAEFEHMGYTLTFKVENETGEEITDAIIALNGQPHDAGHYAFPGLHSGTYNYSVSHESYTSREGVVVITDFDVEETIVLQTETHVTDSDFHHFRIYPNPAQNNLWVEFYNHHNDALITLYDLHGRMISRERITVKGEIRFNMQLPRLLPGVYILELQISGLPALRKQLVISNGF